jgi:acyl-CoA synthetase (AMP-forming)/AMP-acid ligase II
MSKQDTLAADVTVTQRLIAVAASRDAHTALVSASGTPGQPAGEIYSYTRLAAIVQVAAAGLAWRGLQAKDPVGIHVPDAVSFVLAAHAVRAAGGVPCPVAPGLSVAEMAGQLAESGARMLITAPPLAEAALGAADRSWVRQVFSFGDAAATTPFTDLLGLGIMRAVGSRRHDIALLPFSRGQDGRLRPTPVSHIELTDRLDRIDVRAGFTDSDVVLVGPPAGDGLAYATLLDSALLCGATVIAVDARQLAGPAAADRAVAQRATAAIVPDGVRVRLPAPVRVFAVS